MPDILTSYELNTKLRADWTSVSGLDIIFCVSCGEENRLDADRCDSCDRELITQTDDYCSLCGCEQ